MNKSENIGQLAGAFAKAKKSFPAIPRDKEVSVKMRSGGTYKFSYAPLESILRATDKQLAENGLVISQTEHESAVHSCLMHESGEWISNTVKIIFGNGNAQEYGSALTYARRYGVTLLLGISADDDDDANSALGNEVTEIPKAKKGNMTAGKFKNMCSDFAAQIREAGHIDDLKVMIGSPEWVAFKDEAMLRGEMNVIDQEGGLKDHHTRKWNQLKEQAEFEGK